MVETLFKRKIFRMRLMSISLYHTSLLLREQPSVFVLPFLSYAIYHNVCIVFEENARSPIKQTSCRTCLNPFIEMWSGRIIGDINFNAFTGKSFKIKLASVSLIAIFMIFQNFRMYLIKWFELTNKAWLHIILSFIRSKEKGTLGIFSHGCTYFFSFNWTLFFKLKTIEDVK